jgi:L-seryl-tRNA(Ser) seleniumtransferase
MTASHDLRSKLPSVDRVLQNSQDLISRWGHKTVSIAVRQILNEIRDRIAAGQKPDCDMLAVVSAVNSRLLAIDQRGIIPVLNLSGVVLHTNLGLPSGNVSQQPRIRP